MKKQSLSVHDQNKFSSIKVFKEPSKSFSYKKESEKEKKSDR